MQQHACCHCSAVMSASHPALHIPPPLLSSARRKDDDKPLSPAAQAALAKDDYEATPEDLPSGRVPTHTQQTQQAQQAQQAPKGEAAASLRLQPFVQAAAQA